jgi:hypothetical protein
MFEKKNFNLSRIEFSKLKLIKSERPYDEQNNFYVLYVLIEKLFFKIFQKI